MVSLFQIFSVGIGPSSSHTIGPMRAAREFVLFLEKSFLLERVFSLKVDLYGSLAMTGEGHDTPKAIFLGLEGETPEEVDADSVESRKERVYREKTLSLLGLDSIDFNPDTDLIFHKGKRLPFHSNAMKFSAFDGVGKELFSRIYYSVGGGFIVSHEEAMNPTGEDKDVNNHVSTPFPFRTGEELLALCTRNNLKIYELMLANEQVLRSEEEIRKGILAIWKVMKESVSRGIQTQGVLPGGLGVKRRAFEIYQKLREASESVPCDVFDWISLFALAVNEENAGGGKVVTAPTNGSAGVIPAVLHYYEKFHPGASEEGIIRFFLTAAAIGILYKEGASFSAAEMGCQGEIGVACSMAAGGLVAALEGSNDQIEMAAEIGMEHHLGLTCDPPGGLVQIPCIERNTMGSIKAVNAARLALLSDGFHVVSLDQVIQAMKQTGEEMKSTYKETSEAGLALTVSVRETVC